MISLFKMTSIRSELLLASLIIYLQGMNQHGITVIKNIGADAVFI